MSSNVEMIPELTVKEQARREVFKEQIEESKKRYKELFKRLATAKKVVTNIENEIKDLDVELAPNNQ